MTYSKAYIYKIHYNIGVITQFENKQSRTSHYGFCQNARDNKPNNEFERAIYYLKREAKRIRKISFIMKTILGNACYSDRERNAQINKAEKIGHLDDRQLQLLNDGWDLRTELAHDLMTNFESLIAGSK